jgi:cell division protein FtsB
MRITPSHHPSHTSENLFKRIILSPIGLVFWISFCLFLSYGLWNSVLAMRQSITRQQEAKQRLAQEEKKTLELMEKLDKADTSFAKEKIIRDELQMQKPNEIIIQVPQATLSP